MLPFAQRYKQLIACVVTHMNAASKLNSSQQCKMGIFQHCLKPKSRKIIFYKKATFVPKSGHQDCTAARHNSVSSTSSSESDARSLSISPFVMQMHL